MASNLLNLIASLKVDNTRLSSRSVDPGKDIDKFFVTFQECLTTAGTPIKTARCGTGKLLEIVNVESEAVAESIGSADGSILRKAKNQPLFSKSEAGPGKGKVQRKDAPALSSAVKKLPDHPRPEDGEATDLPGSMENPGQVPIWDPMTGTRMGHRHPIRKLDGQMDGEVHSQAPLKAPSLVNDTSAFQLRGSGPVPLKEDGEATDLKALARALEAIAVQDRGSPMFTDGRTAKRTQKPSIGNPLSAFENLRRESALMKAPTDSRPGWIDTGSTLLEKADPLPASILSMDDAHGTDFEKEFAIPFDPLSQSKAPRSKAAEKGSRHPWRKAPGADDATPAGTETIIRTDRLRPIHGMPANAPGRPDLFRIHAKNEGLNSGLEGHPSEEQPGIDPLTSRTDFRTDPADAMIQGSRSSEISYSAIRTQAPSRDRMPGYVMEQVGRQVNRAVVNGDRTIQLKLKPPMLGTLKIEVDLKDNILKLGMTAESHTAKELLMSGTHELKEALSDLGIKLDKIDIQMDLDFNQSSTGSKEGLKERQQHGRHTTNEAFKSEDIQGEMDAGSHRGSPASTLLDLLA